MKKLLWAAPFLALAACEEAPTTTAAAPVAKAAPGEVRGSYNPATTSRDAMIAQIKAKCGGSYDHVWNTPMSDGTVSYIARCS